MTAIRMALNELRRLTAGRMPRLALIAMMLIPTLYASLYLWANHDPYGRLSHVRAALVVEDQPATTKDGMRIAVGEQVAHDLVADGSFDWQQVDGQQADAGVEDGSYVFALRIPRGFSAALASTARFDPERGTLELTTNDANNYLSTTIAEQVISRVGRTIAEKVSEQAASSFLLGFSDLHDKLQQASSGAGRLADGERDLLAGQRRLQVGLATAAGGAGRLSTGSGELADGLDRLARGVRPLSAETGRLARGAALVAGGDRRIARIGDRVARAGGAFAGSLSKVHARVRQQLIDAGVPPDQRAAILAGLDSLRAPVQRVNHKVQTASRQLDRLARGAGQVAHGARRLHAAAGTLVGGIGRADSGARQLHRGARRLASGLHTAVGGSGQLVTGQRQARRGAQRLADGLADGVGSIPDLTDDERTDTAAAIASPVREHDVSQASADSYGAGLAPFFLSIGAWVGAYVMFLLFRPLSNRAIAALQSPLRTAVAGWLAPALIAFAQVSVMLVVVAAIVGIDVGHTAQVALFLLLIGATFVAIVHMLNAWLGAPGQLLGLVLLVLQLASAGGTFPWQTLPAPLQVLHHVLPMTYSLDGLRHLMYAGYGSSVTRDILVLAAYLLGCVVLSSLAARRRRVWRVSQVAPELAL